MLGAAQGGFTVKTSPRVVWLVLASSAGLIGSCSSSTPELAAVEKVRPGEICDSTDPNLVQFRWDPAQLVVAPGDTRQATLYVDPDFCTSTSVSFKAADASLVDGIADASVGLR